YRRQLQWFIRDWLGPAGGGGGGPPPAGRLVAGALLVCLAVSGATALGAADDLHTHIEIAQGETPGR
ncbi:hypothetical protein ACFXPP_36120, partial [Streptomyces sp. NPDC059134]